MYGFLFEFSGNDNYYSSYEAVDVELVVSVCTTCADFLASVRCLSHSLVADYEVCLQISTNRGLLDLIKSHNTLATGTFASGKEASLNQAPSSRQMSEAPTICSRRALHRALGAFGATGSY